MSPGILVYGDTDKLRKILVYLINSAAEASKYPYHNYIKIETRLLNEGGEVLIKVSDSGAGIPKRELDKVTQKEYKKEYLYVLMKLFYFRDRDILKEGKYRIGRLRAHGDKKIKWLSAVIVSFIENRVCPDIIEDDRGAIERRLVDLSKNPASKCP